MFRLLDIGLQPMHTKPLGLGMEYVSHGLQVFALQDDLSELFKWQPIEQLQYIMVANVCFEHNTSSTA
jgi:hypothetical protein